MADPVGIVGVGQLAACLVEGLRRAPDAPGIVLSPRNAERARALAERFGARVAADNQAVADACDVVVLATPPDAAVAAAEAIEWRDGQLMISVCAAVALAPLAAAAAPATAVRAMPVTAAAIAESPTCLHPDEPRARALFERIGSVHAVADEDAYTAACVIATYYAWVFALMGDVAAWTAGHGVPRATARALVAAMTRGACDMALAAPDLDPRDAGRGIARPGTYSRTGLDVLERDGALDAFAAALDAVLARKRGG